MSSRSARARADQISSTATASGSIGLREQPATLSSQLAKIQRSSGAAGFALIPKPTKSLEVFALMLALELPIPHRLADDFAGGRIFSRVDGGPKRRDLFGGQRNADFRDIRHSSLSGRVRNLTTFYSRGKYPL